MGLLDAYLLQCLEDEKNLPVVLSLAKDKLYTFPFDNVPVQWIVLHTVCSILLVLDGSEPIETLDVAVMVAGSLISPVQRRFIDLLYSQHQPELPHEDFALVDEQLFPEVRSLGPDGFDSQRNGAQRELTGNTDKQSVPPGSVVKKRKLSDNSSSSTSHQGLLNPDGEQNVGKRSKELLDQTASDANFNKPQFEGKKSYELSSIDHSDRFASLGSQGTDEKDREHTSEGDIPRNGTSLFASFRAETCPPAIPEYSDTGIDLLVDFQRNLDTKVEPQVFRGLVSDWPACELWNSSKYLLQKTRGGQSLVPVEIGSSYTSESWSQQVMSFKRYLYDYILSPATETGYLAQYNLFNQYPELKEDFFVPDICCLGEDGNPPIMNAWLGPENTISPLHTDPHHNIFCQVVGYKHIRLYSPSQTPNMYPRGVENGIDMSNTSQVNLDSNQKGKFPNFPWNSHYLETTLKPGDALFIPKGWWHYVRSLSSSISISFWF